VDLVRRVRRAAGDLNEMVEAMDEQTLVEEINHQEALLKIQRRNQHTLELQIAKYGPFDVPVHLQVAHEDLRAEVARLEAALRDLRARLRRARRARRKT
jgi:hypothetical protein